MTENELTYIIRGAIFEVYNELGPGLLEKIYESALYNELTEQGLFVRQQVPMPVRYKGKDLLIGYRLDLLVEERIIIEIKSVELIHPVHHKQLMTYLKLMDLRLGILVNFNETQVNKAIFRKLNGYN